MEDRCLKSALPLLVAGAILVPVSSLGALVYRVDGHDCLVGTDYSWFQDADTGMQLGAGQGEWSHAVCSIPVGPAYVNLSDLYYVSFRGRITGPTDELVEVELWAHSYNSTDSCQCDSDFETNDVSTDYYFQVYSYYSGAGGYCDNVSCPGGQVPASDWVVNLSYYLYDNNNSQTWNKAYIKAMSVYSDL